MLKEMENTLADAIKAGKAIVVYAVAFTNQYASFSRLKSSFAISLGDGDIFF